MFLLYLFCSQKVNDARKLKDLFVKARFARCRSRFVVPVILFEGKVKLVSLLFAHHLLHVAYNIIAVKHQRSSTLFFTIAETIQNLSDLRLEACIVCWVFYLGYPCPCHEIAYNFTWKEICQSSYTVFHIVQYCEVR